MIDVTDLPQLKVGDEIEVFGEHQLIETAAKQCGTISYELLWRRQQARAALLLPRRQMR